MSVELVSLPSSERKTGTSPRFGPFGLSHTHSSMHQPADGLGHGWRRIRINASPGDEEEEHNASFPDNNVRTNRYRVWNFVPKNLWEQFHRWANWWFLVVSILQLLPLNVSPTSSWATIVPLSIVLFVTMVKDGYEDWRRYKNDVKVNNRKCDILDPEPNSNKLKRARWADVKVGDIVRLEDGDDVPADMVILATNDPTEGIAYVETAMLDGETSLKPKNAVEDTKTETHGTLKSKRGKISCEPPSNRLDTFTGTLKLDEYPRNTSIDAKNFILKGSRLRNTEYLYGVVIYTGVDTRLHRNSRPPRNKRSKIERDVNWYLFIIAAVLTIMVAISVWLSFRFTDKEPEVFLYFAGESVKRYHDWLRIITFAILYNNLVPISLCVTIDFVRFIQAIFIENDPDLEYVKGAAEPGRDGSPGESTVVKAQARTANLNDDLGQIEYVFSDKTGTITENEMEFAMCSIAGRKYGKKERIKLPRHPPPPPPYPHTHAHPHPQPRVADPLIPIPMPMDGQDDGPPRSFPVATQSDAVAFGKYQRTATAPDLGLAMALNPRLATPQEADELESSHSPALPISLPMTNAASASRDNMGLEEYTPWHDAHALSPYDGRHFVDDDSQGQGRRPPHEVSQEMIDMDNVASRVHYALDHAEGEDIVMPDHSDQMPLTAPLSQDDLFHSFAPVPQPFEDDHSSDSSSESDNLDDQMQDIGNEDVGNEALTTEPDMGVSSRRGDGEDASAASSPANSAVRRSVHHYTDPGLYTSRESDMYDEACGACMVVAPVGADGGGGEVVNGVVRGKSPPSPFSQGSRSTRASPASIRTHPRCRFKDPRILRDLEANDERSEKIDAFLKVMALCHTVIPSERHPVSRPESQEGPCTLSHCNPFSPLSHSRRMQRHTHAGQVNANNSTTNDTIERGRELLTERLKQMHPSMAAIMQQQQEKHEHDMAATGGSNATAVDVSSATNVANFSMSVDSHVLSAQYYDQEKPRPAPIRMASNVHEIRKSYFDKGRTQFHYQAANPDEEAFVVAASCLGYQLIPPRTSTTLTLDIQGEPQTVQIVGINEFNSNRKRMSIVVREHGKEGAMLYCKGADSAMLERLAPNQNEQIAKVRRHINEFAVKGLRTMVLARRRLDQSEYESFSKRYNDARSSLLQREERLEKVAEDFEANLELLGATAIEDKLQPGVAATIKALLDGGIKVWMLTGDKRETAVNVGYACQLIQAHFRRIECLAHNEATALEDIRCVYKKFQASEKEKVKEPCVLVVDGRTLYNILHSDEMKHLFLTMACACKSVLACRVAPAQKAELVRMVKRCLKPHPTTLAIGDGANDVSMLQEADVGVGIIGNEGMQAVRASDYAIGRFRFLRKLLFVHGRLNYVRLSVVILYSFFKNICLILPNFYFIFLNAYSGTSLYESWLLMSYNVVWTSLPIVLYGLLEEDIYVHILPYVPILYQQGQRHLCFNSRIFAAWVFQGLLYGLINAGALYLAFDVSTALPNGKTVDIMTLGTAAFFNTILTVTIKVAMCTQRWTWLYAGVTLGFSVVLFFPSIFTYSVTGWPHKSMEGVAVHLFGATQYWLATLLSCATCFLMELGISHVYKRFYRSPLTVVQEWFEERRKLLQLLAPEELGRILQRHIECSPNDNPIQRTVEIECSAKKRDWRTFVSLLVDRSWACLTGGVHYWKLSGGSEHGKDGTVSTSVSGTPSSGSQRNVDEMLWRFSLRFKDKQIEKEYLQHFKIKIRKYTPFFRVLLGFAILITFMYAGYVTIFELGGGKIEWKTNVAQYFASFALAMFFAFTWSRLFVDQYVRIMITICVLGLVYKATIDVVSTSDGVQTTAMLPVISFVILRIPFTYAFWINVAHMTIFSLRYALDDIEKSNPGGSDSLDERLQILCDYMPILLGITAFSAFVGRRFEYQQRIAFIYEAEGRDALARQREILNWSLPDHIVDTYLDLSGPGRPIISEDPGTVSVIFCDIYAFHELVASMEPTKLVKMLDTVFKAFDRAAERYNCQKIETVAETYLAASGLHPGAPTPATPPDPSNDALTAIRMGVAQLQIAKKMMYDRKCPEKQEWEQCVLHVKIGVHTGKVVAGVVGAKKPQYALFGDTVNTASRMKTTGEADHVHISNSTYEHVKSDPRYKWEARKTHVKGKGLMDTYLLTEATPAQHTSSTINIALTNSEHHSTKTNTTTRPPTKTTSSQSPPMPSREATRSAADNDHPTAAADENGTSTGKDKDAEATGACVGVTPPTRTTTTNPPFPPCIPPTLPSPCPSAIVLESERDPGERVTRSLESLVARRGVLTMRPPPDHPPAPERGEGKGSEELLLPPPSPMQLPLVPSASVSFPPAPPSTLVETVKNGLRQNSRKVSFSDNHLPPTAMTPGTTHLMATDQVAITIPESGKFHPSTRVRNAVGPSDEERPAQAAEEVVARRRSSGGSLDSTLNLQDNGARMDELEKRRAKGVREAFATLHSAFPGKKWPSGDNIDATSVSAWREADKGGGEGDKGGAGQERERGVLTRMMYSLFGCIWGVDKGPFDSYFLDKKRYNRFTLLFREKREEEMYRDYFFDEGNNVNRIEQALFFWLVAYVIQTIEMVFMPGAYGTGDTALGERKLDISIVWTIRGLFVVLFIALLTLFHIKRTCMRKNVKNSRPLIIALAVAVLAGTISSLSQPSWMFENTEPTFAYYQFVNTIDVFFWITILHHASGLLYCWILLLDFIVCAAVLTYLTLWTRWRSGPNGQAAREAFLMIPMFMVINAITSYYKEYYDRLNWVNKQKSERNERRANEILDGVLPQQVLSGVIKGEAIQLAYEHKEVTFLFADIVGFTSWAKGVPPRQVVELLTELFSIFDQETTDLGVYKVCTIGDAYVAVTHGSVHSTSPDTESPPHAPTKAIAINDECSCQDKGAGSNNAIAPRASGSQSPASQHTQATGTTQSGGKDGQSEQLPNSGGGGGGKKGVGKVVVEISKSVSVRKSKGVEGAEKMFKMAHSMLNKIHQVRERLKIPHLNMRIGMHFGNCVGGLIGTQRIRYDIWGIDVLTGNMMESNGVPGKIVASEALKKFVEAQAHLQTRFVFKYHKEVMVVDRPVNSYIVNDSESPYYNQPVAAQDSYVSNVGSLPFSLRAANTGGQLAQHNPLTPRTNSKGEALGSSASRIPRVASLTPASTSRGEASFFERFDMNLFGGLGGSGQSRQSQHPATSHQNMPMSIPAGLVRQEKLERSRSLNSVSASRMLAGLATRLPPPPPSNDTSAHPYPAVPPLPLAPAQSPVSIPHNIALMMRQANKHRLPPRPPASIAMTEAAMLQRKNTPGSDRSSNPMMQHKGPTSHRQASRPPATVTVATLREKMLKSGAPGRSMGAITRIGPSCPPPPLEEAQGDDPALSPPSVTSALSPPSTEAIVTPRRDMHSPPSPPRSPARDPAVAGLTAAEVRQRLGGALQALGQGGVNRDGAVGDRDALTILSGGQQQQQQQRGGVGVSVTYLKPPATRVDRAVSE
ncbi:unnamed protein product [Vitrella brassicaformis CCMP3155]|uniref:P-type phospholipid transporter n=5 Tax=Vitrella brassicaformis TaxID=1169539 RepID=A0A0G4GZN2_VITBC|nr:unnamed protein product [Vitrella brassicaformis CCMP3155]|eukprot:CEM36626.1 unnamed protein product [Vitrella brassicaformis CCMP3155]